MCPAANCHLVKSIVGGAFNVFHFHNYDGKTNGMIAMTGLDGELTNMFAIQILCVTTCIVSRGDSPGAPVLLDWFPYTTTTTAKQ